MAYNLNITYKPDKFFKIKDTLSRVHIKDRIDLCKQEVELQVNMVLKKLNISENILKRFKEKIKKDADKKININIIYYYYKYYKW